MNDGAVNQRQRVQSYGGNACVIFPGTQRLIMTGLNGVKPDGVMEKGMRAQLERAFLNLIETCAAAGFKKEQIVRLSATVSEPGRFQLYREVRDRIFTGQVLLGSYVQVSGLSSPSLLCELEAEAVRE